MNPYHTEFIVKNFTLMRNREITETLRLSAPYVNNCIRKLKDQGKIPNIKPSILANEMKDLPTNEGNRDDLIRSLREKGFSYAGIVKLLNLNISRQRAEQICKQRSTRTTNAEKK